MRTVAQKPNEDSQRESWRAGYLLRRPQAMTTKRWPPVLSVKGWDRSQIGGFKTK